MAIVVVGGSSKDIGKTSLVCGVISALRDFEWTAVKITGHDYAPDAAPGTQSDFARSIVWEETKCGQATDTARYLAAGAHRALLVTRYGPNLPMDEIRAATENDRNIIFESNRIIDLVEPDICVALVGGAGTESKPSFLRLLPRVDVLVSMETVEMELAGLAAGIPQFELQSLDRLTPELEKWLRSRLQCVPGLQRKG